jgi:hypothetical protein
LLACTARLAVYLAAVLAVIQAAQPAPQARIALPSGADPPSLLFPIVLVLGAGVLLELLTGVLRWR